MMMMKVVVVTIVNDTTRSDHTACTSHANWRACMAGWSRGVDICTVVNEEFNDLY
jgi:hypothetical protein